MADIANLEVLNEERWSNAKLTRNMVAIGKSLVAAKPRYQTVERATGVPWCVIAVIHERESSQSWHDSLAQGDPWNEVSTHVPKGRGPFKSWEDAAIDALVNCAPFLAHKDWSTPGSILTNLEEYNGLGYFDGPVTKRSGVIVARYASQPSPYIWSGTDQYHSGKYVADNVYSPSVVDLQPGCAGLLLTMIRLDPSIVIGATRKPEIPLPVPHPAPAAVPAPVAASWLARFASLFGGGKA
ncbi:hypothetical protein [Bradyrhizobium sp. Ai1a-2]|uniref:hypothetical protein n=1 Tax=Bradyrhizobium sp. Ai1a-2 TaxID=196490 RepID=UPI0003F5D82C|nr:hypothetical protein [Bradyrhizobium sp. Ai1a-2]